MNIYQQKILEHYKNPRNNQQPEEFTHSARVRNTLCGDEIEVYLDVSDDIVKSIKFVAEGCAISIASASMLSTELVGKSLSEISELDEKFPVEILGVQLTPSRMKCAHLSLEAIQQALDIPPKLS